jgi:tyrosine-protein kinase Etk/Wzc
MNAPHPLQQQLVNQPPAPPVEEDLFHIADYWDIIVDSRWLIAIITGLALIVGLAYAMLVKPVYESNLLIQVEDSASSGRSLLGDASSLFDLKTPASAEIEIIRSRMVIGRAVDNALLYIDARPNYLPVVGDWMSRGAKALSTPGLFGAGGWVTGAEKIKVDTFDVPPEFEGSRFVLTANGNNRYTLQHPGLPRPIQGTVGALSSTVMPTGSLTLRVSTLEAKPGAEFLLARTSRMGLVEGLQERLLLTEKGRQSGVIDATLQDSEPAKLALTLNEIGAQYVRQNIERKSAEAQKTLAFLDVQVPQFRRQLDQSEEAYNRYRNQQGTVSLDDEAKLMLDKSVELQSKMLEAQQRRLELMSRFTSEHPQVKTLDEQIALWSSQVGQINARIKSMPMVQQDALRLQRDVKVNTDLYQQLRNTAMQLQLVREGKVGNVRLIDPATVPTSPVKPKKTVTVVGAVALGLMLGLALAVGRSLFYRGVRNAHEIEARTGMSVYCNIPLSEVQETLARKVVNRKPGVHLLAQSAPTDFAVESLRSLRTALQFAMIEARNNRLLITGATPGVGKSFVSANLAAVIAATGKRVLLVDADLRKGHLNHYFGIEREKGLSELIVGGITVETAVRRGLLPNLDMITTGLLPPNPSELVVSSVFGQLMEQLSLSYDLVVIDTAPVLVAADTLSIAGAAGALLLVARAEQTLMGELVEAERQLVHAGRGVTGVVLNAIDPNRRHYGSSTYRYGGYKYRNYQY